jgi:hypothetical protein
MGRDKGENPILLMGPPTASGQPLTTDIAIAKHYLQVVDADFENAVQNPVQQPAASRVG